MWNWYFILSSNVFFRLITTIFFIIAKSVDPKFVPMYSQCILIIHAAKLSLCQNRRQTCVHIVLYHTGDGVGLKANGLGFFARETNHLIDGQPSDSNQTCLAVLSDGIRIPSGALLIWRSNHLKRNVHRPTDQGLFALTKVIHCNRSGSVVLKFF